MNAMLLREAAIELAHRDALARPNTFDATARTIEAVIATNSPVQRRDERVPYLEILDVAGADLEALRGASVLNGHRQSLDSVIGTVEDAWREGNELIARLRLSSRQDIAPIVEDIRSGVISSLSVGYAVDEWRDGRDGNTRTRTALKWKPREVSFVPVPADPRARTRDLPTGRAATNRAIRELATRAGVSHDVTNDLIDREASIEEARQAVLDNMLTRSATPIRTAHNERTNDNPEAFIRACGEGLYVRIAPSHTPSGLARQYVGMRIDDLARECLRRSGMQTTGLYGDALITRALHTTSDFALILADTVNRTLRAAYQAAPSGIRQLARQTTAPDFRAKHRLQLDHSGFVLEKVNEHGEFKSGSMVEGDETYRLETFGKIFGITRQALVNDDVGAFADLTRRLGQAAAAFEAQALVNLLTANGGDGPDMSDGNPLFHDDHGNVADTPGSPAYGSTFPAARLAMRRQTGPGGGVISVTPRFLLVPPELETAAERELSEIQAASGDDANVFTDLLTLIVEPRLTDPNRWYIVADPNAIDGLEYAYLAGQPGPQTESQAGFKIDGVEVKVRLDFGAGFVDWRGWYTNEGTGGGP